MGRAMACAVAVVVAFLTLSGVPAASAEEAQRTAGGQPADGASAAGVTPVPMPDLGFAHRARDGGINLYRMPLSWLEDGAGTPQLVRVLPASAGFSWANSRVLAGDFADFTPGDDGTADHLIWHRMPDGSVSLWVVPGSSDSRPVLLQRLRSPWSWASSRPMVGDMNGDGWDDLVVRHAATDGDRWWQFLSDGQRLGAPTRLGGDFALGSMRWSRSVLGDLDGDGGDDVLSTEWVGTQSGLALWFVPFTDLQGGGYSSADAFEGLARRGWSFDNSRQLVGDVSGDGLEDAVTVHRAGDGGIVVWVHLNCEDGTDSTAQMDCFEPPVIWQRLPASAGWSFANSRQYLADTDGDYALELISVHRSGGGGLAVWEHPSLYDRFGAPQLIVNLRSERGWSWANSRESVADTWGVVID